jgi:predicted nucleic acid-binding protein
VRFVDTNVLLYAVSTAPGETAKARAARAVLEARDLALSVQVLQEFYVQATRANRTGRLAHDQASALVESWLRFTVQDTTVPLVRARSRRPFDIVCRTGMRPSSRPPGCSTVMSCCRRT